MTVETAAQPKSFFGRIFPFNAEQTVNLLSEFGPLITLFVVNAIWGVTEGIWALLLTTLLALVVMWMVLRRLPMFALIAGGITIVFSAISLYYDDPMWVQLKVTLFNVFFAAFLGIGLMMKRNFFKYTFEKTFHYTQRGWDEFTRSFMLLFLLLAVANEAVRIGFWHSNEYDLIGWHTDGLNIWVLFKVLVVMPVSGLYAYVMTRRLQKYAITEEQARVAAQSPS